MVFPMCLVIVFRDLFTQWQEVSQPDDAGAPDANPDAIIVDDRYLRRRRITARQLLNAGSFVFLASENYTQPTEGRLKANKAEFYYGAKNLREDS